jgi:hypothetical protein
MPEQECCSHHADLWTLMTKEWRQSVASVVTEGLQSLKRLYVSSSLRITGLRISMGDGDTLRNNRVSKLFSQLLHFRHRHTPLM